jgi:DNA-binding MarR family transcriptional regulator
VHLARAKEMSIAKHHRLRMTLDISWRQDYVLGVLSEEGEVKMSYLRHIGIEYDIRSIVKGLIDKGLISMRHPNERTKLVKLTPQGHEYIQQVKELYK